MDIRVIDSPTDPVQFVDGKDDSGQKDLGLVYTLMRKLNASLA